MTMLCQRRWATSLGKVLLRSGGTHIRKIAFSLQAGPQIENIRPGMRRGRSESKSLRHAVHVAWCSVIGLEEVLESRSWHVQSRHLSTRPTPEELPGDDRSSCCCQY
eukprot:4033113-Amphidinium_carterae.1